MTEKTGQGEYSPSNISVSVDTSAAFLVRRATALQQWSGCLDWGRRLEKQALLTNPALIRSFSKVRRVDFLPMQQQPDEGYNEPIAIGYNQTNSQPTMVAKMLELLRLRSGHSVLEVGAGSGWVTGLIAATVGSKGRVIGTERVPELVTFARENLGKYALPGASVVHTQATLGQPSEGPYNRILVSARMREDWVEELSDQLSPRGGVMVAPVADMESYGNGGNNQDLVVITRHGTEFTTDVAIQGVNFVPLIRDQA